MRRDGVADPCDPSPNAGRTRRTRDEPRHQYVRDPNGIPVSDGRAIYEAFALREGLQREPLRTSVGRRGGAAIFND